MNNAKDNAENINASPLLPKLKQDGIDLSVSLPGKWEKKPNIAFEQLASSLDYGSSGIVNNATAIPTMWAHPLLFETALYDEKHPLHSQVVTQWRGMLAAIALAAVWGFPLKAELIKLGDLEESNEFAKNLFKLLPNDTNVLYTGVDGHNPWEDIYVFWWDDKSVGMSSPTTLIVPSLEGEWKGLPWWREIDQWQTFHEIHRNKHELELLWHWLKNLKGKLSKNNKAQETAVNQILDLINSFQKDLGEYFSEASSLTEKELEKFSKEKLDSDYLGTALNIGALTALRPIKPVPKDSCVCLIPSEGKQRTKGEQRKDLLIIDSKIATQWGEEPHRIWVHKDKNLKSFTEADFKKWKDVSCIRPDDLFFPELWFINQQDALPGSLLPKGAESLFFKSSITPLTPLIPINPILLEYLTPEDLKGRLEFKPNGDKSKVTVILDLPLSGVDNKAKSYRIEKEYSIKEENAIPEFPVLEIWPNFRAEGWKKYYVFYYSKFGDNTFKVEISQKEQKSVDGEDEGNSYQILHLEEFPSFIICQNRQGNNIGIISVKPPKQIISTPEEWHVGVDFGTSFTNVSVRQNNQQTGKPLQLEDLLLQVTSSSSGTRIFALYDYFIPKYFVDIENDQPPLSSLVTTKGSKSKPSLDPTQTNAILDGRIYVPDNNDLKPKSWIHTNLKWSRDISNSYFSGLFLEHLFLHISALALNKGIRTIKWYFSYPSAFSLDHKRNYAKTCGKLIEKLKNKTGVDSDTPTLDESKGINYFRSESLTTAQYFSDYEDKQLIKSVCIDIGGGTSDISIWQDNVLVHQCSVKLAGRDIFAQFLVKNPKFLKERLDEKIELDDWQELESAAFHAKLEVYLRYNSEKLLDKIFYIRNEKDFQEFIRLISIGIAGLYYYVGILLKVLVKEGKCKPNISISKTIDFHLAGNGSRLLNWLDGTGKFKEKSEINSLLMLMLKKGSGFEDIQEVSTKLSNKPKNEVAHGLVLSDTKLRIENSEEVLISGETCELNGIQIEDDASFDIPKEDINNFEINDLVNLRKFLSHCNSALQEVKIKPIKPLNEEDDIYHDSILWERVTLELKKITESFKGKRENISLEPPFILGLKALLKVLGEQWKP